MSSLTDWINATPERRRDYEQERLTVDVAESLQGLLDKAPMKRAELARRMGTSRQSLHQMLSGEQNLTLRTIAIMAHELGCRASVKFEPYSEKETFAGQPGFPAESTEQERSMRRDRYPPRFDSETCEQCRGHRYLGDVPCSACNAMGESPAPNRPAEDICPTTGQPHRMPPGHVCIYCHIGNLAPNR